VSAVLEARNLAFAYQGRCVFSAISLRLEPGAAAGIAGPNGCGKSTLLWCLLGLKKPSAGSVVRNGRVAAVFQNPEDQLFMPSLLEDLALPLLNRGVSRADAERQAASALAAVGLEDLASREASQLSLGQRKRAVIASALVQSPDLLVLDEPTSELDPRSTRRLVEVLNSLPGAKLIASHDMDFLRVTTERLWILDQERIVAEGETARILDDTPLLRRHGLA
jgi:cobalt/nickel transport system ATP-binding protein